MHFYRYIGTRPCTNIFEKTVSNTALNPRYCKLFVQRWVHHSLKKCSEVQGWGGVGKDDRNRVRRMITRYIEQEEDNGILLALRTGRNGKVRKNIREGGGGGEKYKHLPT